MLNVFLIFMSSYKGLGPKKQFWQIRMKLSKPFNRQHFRYAENFLHGLLCNIHRLNCPIPVGRTKIGPLMCCVISLAQYISISCKQCNVLYNFIYSESSINL